MRKLIMIAYVKYSIMKWNALDKLHSKARKVLG
jgi:hypothetical protein